MCVLVFIAGFTGCSGGSGANSTSQSNGTSTTDQKNGLVKQVTGTVRWTESVQAMAANGVTTLYELGSGNVLTGLTRRINRDLSAMAAGTPETVEELAGKL